MQGLVLHTGASSATLEQVREVVTPEATETWQPIAHAEILTLVQEQIEASGMRVTSTAFGLWRDGARFFGMLELRNGHNADDHGLVLGVRNSHDKSFPAGLVLGSRVFVCDNLSFSGEVRIDRKHTSRIVYDLPRLVHAAVDRLVAVRGWQERRIAEYKQFLLPEAQVHDLVIRSIDAQVLPPTKIPQLLSEWREPTHPEFEPRTAWSLFNAYTETLKGSLALLPARTQTLHGLLDATCGIVAPSRQIAPIEEIGVVDAVITQ